MMMAREISQVSVGRREEFSGGLIGHLRGDSIRHYMH